MEINGINLKTLWNIYYLKQRLKLIIVHRVTRVKTTLGGTSCALILFPFIFVSASSSYTVFKSYTAPFFSFTHKPLQMSSLELRFTYLVKTGCINKSLMICSLPQRTQASWRETLTLLLYNAGLPPGVRRVNIQFILAHLWSCCFFFFYYRKWCWAFLWSNSI